MEAERAGVRRRSVLTGAVAGAGAVAVGAAMPLLRESAAQAAPGSSRAAYNLNVKLLKPVIRFFRDRGSPGICWKPLEKNGVTRGS